jgi:hypothetical protein
MLTTVLFLMGLVIAVAVAIRVSRRANSGAGAHDYRAGVHHPGSGHYGDASAGGFGGGSCDSGGGGSNC